MVTWSVIRGKADIRVMTTGPDCGMRNLIVFGPGTALAAVMACRSEPTPLSSAVVTVNGSARAVVADNSDVFPAGSVAVAVIVCPGDATGNDTENVAFPPPSVTAPMLPTYTCA